MKELIEIQKGLKAPKKQYNKFGGYKYRSCEDILEAVKPLVAAQGCTLTLSDEPVMVGDRYYIKATVCLTNGGGNVERTTAYAREADAKKGMDESQITGSASSYARKYALNGLFAIDDTADADATNTHGKEAKEKEEVKEAERELPKLDDLLKQIEAATTQGELLAIYNENRAYQEDAEFVRELSARKELIKTKKNGKVA